MSARSLYGRRPYWISALGHFGVLSALVLVSGLHAPRLFVRGVQIVLPPPGTGMGSAKPLAATSPRAHQAPAPAEAAPSEPPPEEKKPQPERNVVAEPSPDGLLPPPKDDVPSLRPDERDPEKTTSPPGAKRSGGTISAGQEAQSGAAVGGATGAGSGTGIGVEGGVLGAHAPWYLVLLRDKIAANWRPPAAIGRTGPAQAIFHFRVEAEGGVSEVEPVSTSNHFQYDIAARRAIEMAAPLPPLPDELGARSIGITLTFTQVY